jgi:hypothetical protein
MWNKGTIMAIATFILGNGTSAGLQISGIVNLKLGWAIIGISTAISILLFIYAFKLKSRVSHEIPDGASLLQLLDETYQRLKLITGQTIDKLRVDKWSGMQPVYKDAMGLTQMDVNTKAQAIMAKGISDFMSGKPMTVSEDSKQLGDAILKSPLFTTSPEIIAKDASIIVSQNVPYLNKSIKRDRKYKELLHLIKRERDKFPDESVSSAIDTYLNHSITVNSAWVLSEYDLDGIAGIENIVGTQFSTHFKLQLKNLPNQMDSEMEKLRNKIAIAISDYLKGVKK